MLRSSTLLAALALALALCVASCAGDEAVPCALRRYTYGYVCVCNSTYCDTLPRPHRPPNGTALLYTSSESGLRFHKTNVNIYPGTPEPGFAQVLTVDRNTTFQTVKGFGGAFTDATGINLKSLSHATRERLLRSLFSEDGQEYNIGRVPIGGTDFSTRAYGYQDESDDITLSKFKLQEEDYELKIPFIKQAMKLLPEDRGEFLLKAATWSPSPWMKTNGKFQGFGFLLPKYYQCYADYHIKFLDAYAKENLTFYAISTGNEPLNGIVPVYALNALGWLPYRHRKWIAEYFGPTLRNSSHSKLLILAIDDQRYLLPWWLNIIMKNEKAKNYIDGIAVHWYGNFFTPSAILDNIHENYPDKFIISTEASNGDKPWDFVKVQLGSWTRGVYYIGDIIKVMNHWCTGWVDWNLALNMTGGPNWRHNYVDSIIIVNAEKDEFYKQPTFYALGHVSKFVPPGSKRVNVTSQGGEALLGKVSYIAFKRPDDGIAVVLLNRHNTWRDVVIQDETAGYISLELRPRSFTTVVYWGGADEVGSGSGALSSSGVLLACVLLTLRLLGLQWT